MQQGYSYASRCVVCLNDLACAITGDSSLGKSTLSAAFFKKGSELFAEGVCWYNQQGEVIPSFPQLKLWQDAAEALSIDITKMRKIRPADGSAVWQFVIKAIDNDYVWSYKIIMNSQPHELIEQITSESTLNQAFGCPLSPLIAAVYLKPLDDALSQYGFYVRFMDDWCIMTKTKYQLRRAIKCMHRVLNELKLKVHPDKTYMGVIRKEFDFLGVHFGSSPRIAELSQERHQTQLNRRYAQNASSSSIGEYLVRWQRWCRSVLKCVYDDFNAIETYLSGPTFSPRPVIPPKETRDEKRYEITTNTRYAHGFGNDGTA